MPVRARFRIGWASATIAVAVLAVACGLIGSGERVVDDGVVSALSEMITREMEEKGLPAVSIALVVDQEVTWAAGFGFVDEDETEPATASTVYRVGSVSKLFTDIAVMQRVERGELDLDAPVADVLPDFRPDNPFGGEITLRQLTSHRAGLMREPPVGSYFDPTSPTLAATVASLNGLPLIHPPGEETKYSNAGIAVVGRAFEEIAGRPFVEAMKRSVLAPMGLDDSAFEREGRLAPRVPRAVMWSYDGREFDAPTFELGMAPAGSLYSTVEDLGRFLSVLFAGGVGPRGRVLKESTLAQMMTPQFAAPDATKGYGIGFGIGELDGRRKCGHGGAIYGFATQLSFLPDERLGVVVTTNVDVANSVMKRVADHALRLMVARRHGAKPPAYVPATPLPAGRALEVEGRYARDGEVVELVERDGRLFATIGRKRAEVKERDGALWLDDRISWGPRIDVESGRVSVDEPSPVPDRWRGLVGEYGWDHNVLVVFEKDDALCALVEWIEIDRLTELSPGSFAFPTDGGLYPGERIEFVTDPATGRATAAVVAGVRFLRREIQGESVATFTIDPIFPADELRRIALAAEPPPEPGEFHETELVDLAALDSTVALDIRYASTNNFMQTTFYPAPRAFMQRAAAEAVVRVHRALAAKGYGLLIHDAYRPWYVTKMFWDATPAAMKHFVADPSKGSRHNRGCAVDLTLFDLATNEPVDMGGLYDEFSERSYPDYVGGTSRTRWHRELLRDAMEAESFTVYAYEWWHFDYRGWEKYRIGNEVFGDL